MSIICDHCEKVVELEQQLKEVAMSYMSKLDAQLKEAGIDPESLPLQEAVELLQDLEIAKLFDDECADCDVPEEGMILYRRYKDEVEIWYCNHRCRLTMPEHIAAELLGLEDTEEVSYE